MTEPNELITGEIARNAAEATLSQVDGRWVLTMTRFLRHPAERVWPMLTEVDQLGRWSPVVPDRTLESTGPALLEHDIVLSVVADAFPPDTFPPDTFPPGGVEARE